VWAFRALLPGREVLGIAAQGVQLNPGPRRARGPRAPTGARREWIAARAGGPAGFPGARRARRACLCLYRQLLAQWAARREVGGGNVSCSACCALRPSAGPPRAARAEEAALSC